MAKLITSTKCHRLYSNLVLYADFWSMLVKFIYHSLDFANKMLLPTNLSKTRTPKIKLLLTHQQRTFLINFRCPQRSPTQYNASQIHLKLPNSRSGAIIPCPATKISNLADSKTFHGICYVVGDNIDTDQIIPTQYLTLNPSNPEDYAQLGAYALIGLPSTYTTLFVESRETKSKYSILIAGANFGCGSSREHAPMALGAAGINVIVAESYARILFRNCVSTGEVYPLESEIRICEECKTGDEVSIDLEECKLVNYSTGKEYKLKPVGDVKPIIDAGGIFTYATKIGMIRTKEDRF